MRLIARLVKITDLCEAENLIENIFIVSNSVYEGYTDDTTPSESENSKLYLKKRIACFEEILIDNEEQDFNEISLPHKDTTDTTPEEQEETSYIKWLKDLEIRAQPKYYVSSTNSLHEKQNCDYLPEFSKSFMKLMRTYVLWSEIMTKYFNNSGLTASSAIIESAFNDLKNRSFHNDNLPIRVDKFVCKHVKDVEGLLKIEEHDIYTKKSNNVQFNLEFNALEDTELIASKKTDLDNPILPEDIDNIDLKENWRGLGNPSRNLKKKNQRSSFYAAPAPEIMYMNDSRKVEIPLIKNGNLIKCTRVTKYYNQMIMLANTCAYDSILQSLACAYCDSTEFNEYFTSASNEIRVFNCISTLIKCGPYNDFLNARIELLQDIGDKQTHINGTVNINCQSNITFAFEKICAGLESAIESYVCSSCKFQFVYKRKTVFLAENEAFQVQLEKRLMESVVCRSCNKTVSLGVTYNNLLFMECELTDISLNELPVLLRLSKNYILRSAIVYVRLKATPDSIGHYFCVCRRNDGAWETYNDLNNKMHVASSTQRVFNIHSVMYSI